MLCILHYPVPDFILFFNSIYLLLFTATLSHCSYRHKKKVDKRNQQVVLFSSFCGGGEGRANLRESEQLTELLKPLEQATKG